jgi:uncharacterized protein
MVAVALVFLTSASYAEKNVATKQIATAKKQPAPKAHRLVIQVDQNDPAVMNLALNNATNLIDYYRAKGQDVNVDVVTYGPGLHMLRADTSPVQERIKILKDYAFQQDPVFRVHNTKEVWKRRKAIRSTCYLRPSSFPRASFD